jgi:hypothetical protein
LKEIKRLSGGTMDWISKEFLIAGCVSLLIALIAVSWPRPLVRGPPAQAATERYERPVEVRKESYGFYYARFGQYIDATANYCTSERPNAASEWQKKFICESKITDVVIAGLTLFLMIFTGLLVWVGNKQEKTTRRQMRAFVYVNDVTIFNVAHPLAPLPGYRPTGAEIISPTEGPLVRFAIKNTGSTPAYRVVHWAAIHIADFPLTVRLPAVVKAGRPTWSVLPPDGITTKMIKIPTSLTPEQIAGLRSGNLAVWIYGEISYTDAFRRKRTSTYRLFHNSYSGTIGITTELTWADTGNDAT